MGIEAKFDFEALRKEAYEWRNNVLEAIKEAFMLACLDTVNQAKANNTYIDQTGNLRSSIGYVLYYDGEEIGNYFQATPADAGVSYIQYYNVKKKDGSTEKVGRIVETKGGSGQQGAKAGAVLARAKAEELGDKGFVSVIVAGEHYARYVEAKGFDVLTGSTLRFADNLKRRLAEVNNAFGTKF